MVGGEDRWLPEVSYILRQNFVGVAMAYARPLTMLVQRNDLIERWSSRRAEYNQFKNVGMVTMPVATRTIERLHGDRSEQRREQSENERRDAA